jgi:hypothetical protein
LTNKGSFKFTFISVWTKWQSFTYEKTERDSESKE